MGVHLDNPVMLPAPAGKYSHISRVSAGEFVRIRQQIQGGTQDEPQGLGSLVSARRSRSFRISVAQS